MGQMIVSGIALGAIYGLVALGIVLVFKATGVLNFAHGESIMISTFVAFSLIKLGVPYWLVVILTLLFAALFAAGSVHAQTGPSRVYAPGPFDELEVHGSAWPSRCSELRARAKPSRHRRPRPWEAHAQPGRRGDKARPFS